MREFKDENGTAWQVVVPDAVVAHGRRGAVLAFRRTDEPDGEPLRTGVTFNSRAAAEGAILTLSEKELRRRLALARAALGTP